MTPNQYFDLGVIAIVALAFIMLYYGVKVAISLIKVKKTDLKVLPIGLIQSLYDKTHGEAYDGRMEDIRILSRQLLRRTDGL